MNQVSPASTETAAATEVQAVEAANVLLQKVRRAPRHDPCACPHMIDDIPSEHAMIWTAIEHFDQPQRSDGVTRSQG